MEYTRRIELVTDFDNLWSVGSLLWKREGARRLFIAKVNQRPVKRQPKNALIAPRPRRTVVIRS